MKKRFIPKILPLAIWLAVAGTTQSAQAATDTWSGATNGTWDTTTSNWLTSGTFNSGDDALFTGMPTNNVTTATGLTVGAITMDNTFTGSVTLSGANTVSGPVTVNAGTLLLGNNTGAGTATINLVGGTLGVSVTGLTVANTINVTGTATIGQNSNYSLTLSGSLTGAGKLQNKTATGSAPNLFFTGDLSGFTGTLSYTDGSPNTTATWRVGATGGATIDLSNATLSLTAGGNNSCDFGFLDGTTVANTLKIGTLNGNGVFQGSYNGTAGLYNTLEVGAGTFSGVLGRSTNNMMNLNLTKVGSGTLTLSGLNIYTGATTVNGGTLQMNTTYNGTTPYSASVTVNNGATLALNASDALGWAAGKYVPTINSGGTITNITSASRVTLWNGLTMTGGTLTGASTISDGNGEYSLSGTVTATSDASGIAATMSGTPISLQNRNVAGGTITFNVTRGSATPASDLNVSANLVPNSAAANVGITKTGDGIMTLTGSNTYTGTTTISGGTLKINGLHSGAGAYTVQNGGTLGGSGTITTAANAGITLQAGGKLSPGNSPGTLTADLGTGVFDISAGVAATNSQSLLFDLTTTSASDRVLLSNASSTFNIGTGVLEFDDFVFTTGAGFGPGLYTLFDSNNASGITGSLGSIVSGTIGSYAGTLSITTAIDGSQDIVLDVTAVPEPATYGAVAGLALTGLSLTRVIRRRKRPMA